MIVAESDCAMITCARQSVYRRPMRMYRQCVISNLLISHRVATKFHGGGDQEVSYGPERPRENSRATRRP